MSPPIGYPISTGQSWNHLHASNTEWTQKVEFTCLCIYVYVTIIFKKRKSGILQEMRAWEELKKGKGIKENYVITL